MSRRPHPVPPAPSGEAETKPWRAELRGLVRLALPVVVVQVGMMMLGVVDILMVGRFEGPYPKETALSAVVLGNAYNWGCLVFAMGCLMALDAVVSQAAGARDDEAVGLALQRGLVLAGLLTVPAALLYLPAEGVLGALGQDQDVARLAAAYVRINAAAILPFLVFTALRQTLQALGRLFAIVATIAAANAVNLALDWAFIHGRLGMPALGVEGAAWATVIGRWLSAILLLALAWPALRPHLRRCRRKVLAWRPLLRMLRLGAPIGAQFQLEYGAFAAALVLMGQIGRTAQAGHGVALNLASLSFMVPLGISAAAAVRVGWAVGRGDQTAVRRAALAPLALGTAVMAGFGVLFLALPAALARIYTDDAGVAAMAALLIPVAGFFQVFDGIQVVSIGVLRGMGDTRGPMVLNVLGFWMLGLPVSWIAVRVFGGGPVAVWWGLVLGLAAVAVLLLLRVRTRLRQRILRVAIDAPPAPAPAAHGP